jgi:hypothetical protein
MRKSTIAIGIAAALATPAFVASTNANAAVKHKLQRASGPIHTQHHFKYPNHSQPTGSTVLYDQTGSVVNGAPSQNFESAFDQYDAQGADDFVVTDAAGWTLSAFNFVVSATADPSSATYDIVVLPDDGSGLPGSTPVCSYPGATGVLTSGNTALSVALPSPCVLAQGTYWIEMVVNLDFGTGGQVFWSDYSPSGTGSNAKWQNPGGGFGTACSTWSDMATCVGTGSPVGGGQTAFMFQVVGAVGGGGGGTCDAGDLCLVSTVGTDTSPGACGTTDTIDASVGDQLNFCYTITNNTGVELDYHTLENNIDDTLFSLLNEPVPPGGTFQYNHVETMGPEATYTYNSTWTGQDVPPGYAAEVETGGGGGCPDRIFADGFDGSTPPCGGGSNFVDISSTGTPLGLSDDGSADVTMPFSFNFYGTTSNLITVANNGGIIFNTPGAGLTFSNVSLPAALSGPAILPLWDDFDSSSGNVYTDTRGSSPNRQFIVEWYQRTHFSGNTDSATFEVILNEADGTLQFEYLDVDYTADGDVSNPPDPPVCDGGVCATIGLQNDPGLFNQFSAFEASVTDNSGIKWSPTTPQVFTGTDTVTVNVGAPDINVVPPSITGTVPAGGSTSTVMDIQNLGNRDLNWTADEAPPPQFHFPIGPRYAPSTLRPGETNVGRQRPSQEWLRAHGLGGQQKPARHVSNPLGGTTPSFGCSIISSSSCEYVSFDADVPGTLNDIANENELMFGATFVNNDFTKEYVVGYPSGDLETIDTTTGARTTVGSTGQGTNTRDIAYDAQTGTTFGTAISGDMTDLFTVDTTTGAMTLVGTINGVGEPSYVMGLAVDPSNGLMYGIEIVSSTLIAIDKTSGDASTVGSLGFSTRFGQGLDFNAATHTLYLASIDYGGGTGQNMYTVDLTTGAASLVGPFPSGTIQIGAFGIAVPNGPCGTPADQPWLSLSPTSGTTAGGDDSPVTVSINAAGTSDGDTLAGTICVRSNDPDEAVVEVPVTYTVGTGGGGGNITENFDGVAPPALPSGWTTAASGAGVPWVTESGTADSAPNAAFASEFPSVSDMTLDTVSFTGGTSVTFVHSFNLETNFDGAVLEISINGGAFQDILAAGGSFATNGYVSTISSSFMSPIAGRQAWTGSSGGFISTTVNLPAGAAGQSVVLRFRTADDSSATAGGTIGWWVDSITSS